MKVFGLMVSDKNNFKIAFLKPIYELLAQLDRRTLAITQSSSPLNFLKVGQAL